MADAPILGFRSPSIDAVRGLLAFWVLCAHLFAWSSVLNQSSGVLTAMFEWLGRLFQSNGEKHPAVLGFIVLSGYCIHRTGFRRRGGSQISLRAGSSESGRCTSSRSSPASRSFSPPISRIPRLPRACHWTRGFRSLRPAKAALLGVVIAGTSAVCLTEAPGGSHYVFLHYAKIAAIVLGAVGLSEYSARTGQSKLSVTQAEAIPRVSGPVFQFCGIITVV